MLLIRFTACLRFVCFITLWNAVICYSLREDFQSDKQIDSQIKDISRYRDGTIRKVNYDEDQFSDVKSNHDMKTTEPFTLTTDELIPDFYKIIVVAKLNEDLSYNEIIQTLIEALAKVLNSPTDSIRLSKYEVVSGNLKMSFIYAADGGVNDAILFPASDLIPNLPLNKVKKEAKNIEILSIKSGAKSPLNKTPLNVSWNIFSDGNWRTWQLAVIIASSLFAFFCIFIIILFLFTRRNTKDSINTVEERQVVVQPVLKPNVMGVNVIQPENKDSYITETDSEHTPSPCRSPMRIKGKGLLERRGSNASLTLDLNRSQENIHYGTPPKECSSEEYLLSANRRLTRRQLKNCLKDVKALHTEFWEIPMNHPEKVEVAGSGTKNRYKTILPNELTRVQLRNTDEDPLSSYINANYIRGYANERNAYIATQGPMAHTVNDFWTMVWEQKSPIIVMITKLKEKLKIKCEPYIPDYQNTYMGIKVVVKKVLHQDGYTIRELYLTNGRESRTVHHFWYTAWPDHKTPDTAKQLLNMALEVDRLRHHGNGTIKGPTVVHCSAGIGRTGCFIAVSIGIQQLLEENIVDVLGIVCGLRLDRGGMVQTAEQYEFVHQALGVFESTLDQSGD